MSAVTTERRRGPVRGGRPRPPRGPRPAEQTPTLFGEVGREPTLDELITGAWGSLTGGHAAACPVCGGDLVPGYGAHARPSEGRCGDCGTVLS